MRRDARGQERRLRDARRPARCDAIIDDATWAATQALVGTRKPNMKTHDDGHLNILNRLLVCPVCNRKMSSKPNRGKLKKDGTRKRQRGRITAHILQKARGASCTFKSQYSQECVKTANDKRMRMLMTQIDSLAPADRSYERKFKDLQRCLDDLYDRDAELSEALDETQAKMTTTEKRMDGERRLLEELDRIPELLEGADEQTHFDLIHEAVS